MIITTIIALLGLLIVAVVIKAFTHHTYIETSEGAPQPVSYKIAGTLKRQKENTQFYVIDPADKTFMWVNGTDDMYEDANGKIWRLVE